MKNTLSKFDSLRELIDYAADNTDTRTSDDRDPYFAGGTDSLAHAVNMARNGWDAVRPDVDKMLSEIADSFGERFAKVNRTVVGYTGGAVHMGRFLTGRPDHMVGFRRMPSTRHGKVVRLIVDYGANGNTPAANMQKRGCVLTVLVDALATLGLSVELWGETTVKVGASGSHTTLVKLHDSREPLDINDMMFALAHPSMLRRLTFSVRERAMGAAKMYTNGYGQSTPITHADNLEADVVCNRIEHGGSDALMMRDPVAWILQTINGLGV